MNSNHRSRLVFLNTCNFLMACTTAKKETYGGDDGEDSENGHEDEVDDGTEKMVRGRASRVW